MTWSVTNLTIGTATPLTIPATSAGNLIVVAIAAVAAASGVTDNASNAYVQAGSNATVTGGTAAIWYCLNCKAGATSVTLSGPPTTPDFAVYEVTGIDPVSGFDTSANVNSGASSATPSGGTVNAATSGEFIVAAIWPVNSITGQVAGNEFTLDGNPGGDGLSHVPLISAASGNHTPQWNQNISGVFCAITAAFKTGSVTASVN